MGIAVNDDAAAMLVIGFGSGNAAVLLSRIPMNDDTATPDAGAPYQNTMLLLFASLEDMNM